MSLPPALPRRSNLEASKMCAENLGLVHLFVKRMKPSFFEREDLLQIGTMGLMKAALRYDTSEHTVTFATFSWWFIHREILSARVDQRLVRIPIHTLKKMIAANAVPEAPMRLDLGSEETFELPGEEVPADLQIERHEQVRDVRVALRKLSPRAQRILRWHFDKGMTLPEIGAELGVSKQAVHQVKQEAIVHLRDILSADEDHREELLPLRGGSVLRTDGCRGETSTTVSISNAPGKSGSRPFLDSRRAAQGAAPSRPAGTSRVRAAGTVT
jgi:RNA polymerase sigma factor (sigma-70 family)